MHVINHSYSITMVTVKPKCKNMFSTNLLGNCLCLKLSITNNLLSY